MDGYKDQTKEVGRRVSATVDNGENPRLKVRTGYGEVGLLVLNIRLLHDIRKLRAEVTKRCTGEERTSQKSGTTA